MSLLPFFLMLLFYLFTGLLPHFSIYCFQNRPIPFPGWSSYEVTKPGYSFFALIL